MQLLKDNILFGIEKFIFVNCLFMLIIVITLSLFCLYAALLLVYRSGWARLPLFEIIPPGEGPFITVVISARNEEANIGECLASLAAQTYTAFEVIVVDDFSTDGTAEVAGSFPYVKLIRLSDHVKEKINSFKKKAIETAIGMASGELILTTDADCTASPRWLETIAGYYRLQKPACIAAPVSYCNEKNFLARFQSLDFMTLQGITGAAAQKKMHTMCNGANFAYTKEAFMAVDGFAGIDNIASGDDMLLMHKIALRYPGRVSYLKSRAAIVHTRPAATPGEFMNQRIRWASKADKYADKKITMVLALVYLFNAMLLVTGIVCFFYPYLLWWLATLLLAKTLIELWFLYPVAQFFKKEKMLWWFPLAQPFHILYTILAGWLGKFGSYRWKDRKVK